VGASTHRLGDLPDRHGTTVDDDHPVWVVAAAGELYRTEWPSCPPEAAAGCRPRRIGPAHKWGVIVVDAVTHDLRGAWFGDDGAWPSYWNCLVDADPALP
jgi:hypothetical protein